MSDLMSYWLGVFLAVTSGIINNIGTVLQKKVVNDLPPEARTQRFIRSLARKPVWLLGLILQLGVGSIFFMLAQVFIGPALIPGLMASGLIVLAIGSIRIIGERLRAAEGVGIALMILGIAVLGLSGLVIETESYDVLDTALMMRVTLFTLTLSLLAVGSGLAQRKAIRFRATLLAILSGCLLAMSNFWIFPLMATIFNVFTFAFILPELTMFILAAVILVSTNMLSILAIQNSFKYGQASLLIPIQQIPIQVAPAFVYLAVFVLAPPFGYFSLALLGLGIASIVTSSFLLAKRQVQIQAIK